jgi:hypothetical protein
MWHDSCFLPDAGRLLAYKTLFLADAGDRIANIGWKKYYLEGCALPNYPTH